MKNYHRSLKLKKKKENKNSYMYMFCDKVFQVHELKFGICNTYKVNTKVVENDTQ